MPNTALLTGQTGQTYEYAYYPSDASWNPLPGCYAFARVLGNTWPTSTTALLYIGQTDSFQRRMREHADDAWKDALREGANYVLAHTVANEAARLAEERDLIRAYQPRLNTQHASAHRIHSRNPLLGL